MVSDFFCLCEPSPVLIEFRINEAGKRRHAFRRTAAVSVAHPRQKVFPLTEMTRTAIPTVGIFHFPAKFRFRHTQISHLIFALIKGNFQIFPTTPCDTSNNNLPPVMRRIQVQILTLGTACTKACTKTNNNVLLFKCVELYIVLNYFLRFLLANCYCQNRNL